MLAFLTALATLSGCASSKEPPKALSIVFASDLHHLSPEMTDYGENFMDIIKHGDGKVTHYTTEITKAFVSQILSVSPDAVVLSGDITLNGDATSHEELAVMLAPLVEAGIGVYVIPGNHDVDGTAYIFSGEDILPIDAVTIPEFAEIYDGLGYSSAFSRDESSLSYTAKLNEDLWLLMIDVNGNDAKSIITENTLSWAKKQLEKAKKAGATVIGVSHQNLLVHSSRFQFGYQMVMAEDLIALYKKYGVKTHFSGHLHIQHIQEESGITDIASSCIAVSPSQYGVLSIASDRSMSYQTYPVDVSAWASQNGVTDENLLNFAQYSADFFDYTTEYKTIARLESDTLPEEDREEMKAFAIEANRRYFDGTLSIFLNFGSGLALWKKNLPDSSYISYIESMAQESPRDMNRWPWE